MDEPRLTLTLRLSPDSDRIHLSVGRKKCYFGRSEKKLRRLVAKVEEDAEYRVLDNDRVSSVHFAISWQGIAFYAQDVGSTNGTYLLLPTEEGEQEVFLGNKAQECPPAVLQPLSSLLIAAELRCIIESVHIPSAMAFTDDDNDTSPQDSTAVSAAVEKDYVLHIHRGPGHGTHFVLRRGARYIFGRASRRGPSRPSHVGIRLLKVTVDPTHPERHDIKHRHAEISFLSQRERNLVQGQAKYKIKARERLEYLPRDAKSDFEVADAEWRVLEAGESLFFNFDDMIKVGPCVFFVSPCELEPTKIRAPMVLARTPHAMRLWWPAKNQSETTLTGYDVQYAHGENPDPQDGRLWSAIHAPNNTALLKDLEPHTTLSFRVRGRNGAGVGPWSDIVTYRTATAWSDSITESGSDYSEDDESGAGTADGAGAGGVNAETGASGADGAPLLDSVDASDAVVSAVLGPVEAADPAALRFIKTRMLGKGGQGCVYQAMDMETGSMMAVKEMLINPNDPSAVQQADALTATVRRLIGVQFPNIVRYKGVERTDRMLRLFLEYCGNGSLRGLLDDMVDADGLPEMIASRYCAQVLKGLQYLHAQSILHRDIKAANVLMHVAGDVLLLKIADFGLADCLSQEEFKTAKSKRAVGTPYYMSPELVRGDAPMYGVDIWAVGCLVYELITGQPPLIHLGRIRAIFFIGKMRDEGHKLPQSCNPSKELEDFLECCFKSDPQERATTEELLNHAWIVKNA